MLLTLSWFSSLADLPFSNCVMISRLVVSLADLLVYMHSFNKCNEIELLSAVTAVAPSAVIFFLV